MAYRDPLEGIVLTDDILERLREGLEKLALEQKACEEKGHPDSKEITRCYFRGSLEIGMKCLDCGSIYERKPTVEDYRSLERALHSVVD